MRMDTSQGMDAAAWLASVNEAELSRDFLGIWRRTLC